MIKRIGLFIAATFLSAACAYAGVVIYPNNFNEAYNYTYRAYNTTDGTENIATMTPAKCSHDVVLGYECKYSINKLNTVKVIGEKKAVKVIHVLMKFKTADDGLANVNVLMNIVRTIAPMQLSEKETLAVLKAILDTNDSQNLQVFGFHVSVEKTKGQYDIWLTRS